MVNVHHVLFIGVCVTRKHLGLKHVDSWYSCVLPWLWSRLIEMCRWWAMCGTHILHMCICWS